MAIRRIDIEVIGVDNSKEALEIAGKTWKHERNKFFNWDLNLCTPAKPFDWLVSFETIEHLQDPTFFLNNSAKSCANIVCSVPNQAAIPFTKQRFPFHYRHYTADEITELLEDCGFAVTKILYQRTGYAEGFNSKHGRSIIIEGKSKNI